MIFKNLVIFAVLAHFCWTQHVIENFFKDDPCISEVTKHIEFLDQFPAKAISNIKDMCDAVKRENTTVSNCINYNLFSKISKILENSQTKDILNFFNDPSVENILNNKYISDVKSFLKNSTISSVLKSLNIPNIEKLSNILNNEEELQKSLELINRKDFSKLSNLFDKPTVSGFRDALNNSVVSTLLNDKNIFEVVNSLGLPGVPEFLKTINNAPAIKDITQFLGKEGISSLVSSIQKLKKFDFLKAFDQKDISDLLTAVADQKIPGMLDVLQNPLFSDIKSIPDLTNLLQNPKVSQFLNFMNRSGLFDISKVFQNSDVPPLIKLANLNATKDISKYLKRPSIMNNLKHQNIPQLTDLLGMPDFSSLLNFFYNKAFGDIQKYGNNENLLKTLSNSDATKVLKNPKFTEFLSFFDMPELGQLLDLLERPDVKKTEEDTKKPNFVETLKQLKEETNKCPKSRA